MTQPNILGLRQDKVGLLPREFKQTSLPIGMRSLKSFATLTVGSALLIGVLSELRRGSSLLTTVTAFAVCSLVALAICGFVAATSFANATKYVISCTEEGFSVTSGKRWKWHGTASYAWSSIMGTRYSEIYFRTRIAFFQAQTEQGYAFEIDNWHTDNFDELIEVFNTMTPHLGYVWKKQDRGWRGYRKVDRA